MVKARNNNNTEEPIEKQLWKAADKLRKNIDAAEYKHIVLGLIFLKYISDAFEELFDKLKKGEGEYAGADPEDKDEYKAENVFFVPGKARWSYLQSKARLPEIGKEVDNAMDAIDKDNPSLRAVLPKVYARGNLDPTNLGGLIDLVGNIALEVLKKLLNDEIKTRTKKNLVQSKSLMEMLEESIKKYHNKILTAAEVIEELIRISKEIRKMDKEPREMGLSDFEYAFYTAIADNDSAREVMGKDKLRELAVVLFEKVKANASIDWTIKESVKAKLKVIVKRTLRKYGYPPDMQKLATETVLKQAELIAEEITQGK